MRIAYVGIHLQDKIIKGGVGQKIISQLNIWQQKGHDTRLFLLSPDTFTIQDVEVFRFLPPAWLPKVLQKIGLEINRSRALSEMIAAVRQYCPDIIYLRYGLYAYPLERIFSVAPVVVELNSLDVQEYRYRGPFFYWLNRLTRGITLRRAKGITPVSHEIARANASYRKPMQVIANGINLSSFEPLPAPANKHPRMVFIGTPGYRWHGVDKLVLLAKRCPDLQIDVIGYRAEDFPGSLPENLILHGFLKQPAMAGILANADVAFGTLALHRNQMEEGSPLKVREALAFGIPLILPYQDTDLSGCDDPCILQIPNTEDNLEVHAGVVHQFAYQVMGKRVDRERIYPRIDRLKKEEARLAFFEQICIESKRKVR